MGKQWKQWQTLSSWAPKSLQMVTTAMKIKRYLLLGRKATTNLNNILKSRDITLLTKVCILEAVWFSSSHVKMWELDHKEGWAPNNWCFPTVVLEKTPESPFNSKEIQPVHPKGKHSWIFTGRTDAEALILWPPDAKSWLTGKDPDAGKECGQEKGVMEDEMLGWHQLNGHEFEQTPGDSEGQGTLCVLQSMGSWKSLTGLSGWTTNNVTANKNHWGQRG